MNIIFFGSFQHYSTLILESLHQHEDINVVGVVTTPPMPAGRKQILTKTHTHTWAEENNIPTFTPNKLNNASLDEFDILLKSNSSSRSDQVSRQKPDSRGTSLQHKPDFFIVAGFGKILPQSWLQYPKHSSLNIHFSLLPNYRGANPAEWALLLGEKNTGISLITMNPKIDQGDIISQKDLAISNQDSRETLYHKLYSLAAKHSPDMILKYFNWLQKKDANCQTSLAPRAQGKSTTPYARLLKRDDGFLPWSTIHRAITGQPLSSADFSTNLFNYLNNWIFSKEVKVTSQSDYIQLINRSTRALYRYPGLWTLAPTSKGEKRLKIHSSSIYKNKLKLEQVQLEGQSSSTFNQIKNQLTL